jgi:hypothetical protein
MKAITLLKIAVIFALCGSAVACYGQTIEAMPPVVVKTVPEAGTKDVRSGEFELKVVFSKEMKDNGFSFVGPLAGATFNPVGNPSFEADRKTCVWKVKLEPGKTYAYWLNSPKFQNFKDTKDHPAIPYLLVFQTKQN